MQRFPKAYQAVITWHLRQYAQLDHSNRKQNVSIAGEKSEWRDVVGDVPQELSCSYVISTTCPPQLVVLSRYWQKAPNVAQGSLHTRTICLFRTILIVKLVGLMHSSCHLMLRSVKSCIRYCSQNPSYSTIYVS